MKRTDVLISFFSAQAVNSDVRLDLPQVAVVGSQSSGKSSVLEALVGRDFLPRGPNIVTRRPLILQLIRTTAHPGQYAEWGEFLHAPGKRFYDFERIRQEIIAETERLLGSTKSISDHPIRLRIHSPHVLTMTIIDLPGIARVPVGDQPADIESKLRELILQYISSPSCIILAVTPANQDLASSDALELARRADPDGARTIGVLTKLDIMDRGTDAVAVLRNEVIPLRLGYVGVVLRSQEDVSARKTMAEARQAEKIFFQSRQEYAAVGGSCGIGTLARALNMLLVDAIRDALPELRAQLEEALESRKKELRVYGEAPPGNTGAARGALLLSILDSYASRYLAALDGHGEHLPITELAGGARIRHIFREIFNTGLDSLDPSAELSDDDVRTAITNSGGIKGSLLIPEAPFEVLVRRAIERLLQPSLQCKEFVHAELIRIAAQCMPPDTGRFPALQSVLAEAVEEFINGGAAPAERMIRDLVACELSYINTSHPQFIGGNCAIAQVLERRSVAPDSRIEAQNDTLPAHRPSSAKATGSHPVSGTPSGLAVATSRRYPPSVAGAVELFRPEELLDGGGIIPVSGRDPEAKGPPSTDDGIVESRGWLSQWLGKSGSWKLVDANKGDDDQDADESEYQVEATSPSGRQALHRPPVTLRVPRVASDQEGVQVEVTRVLVDSYFDIVRKNLQDAVPKALMHFMVNNVRRGLQQHLIRTMYREELLEELMAEREDVAARRSRCQDEIRLLQSAIKMLENVPQELTGRLGNNFERSGAWTSSYETMARSDRGRHSLRVRETVHQELEYSKELSRRETESRSKASSNSPLKHGMTKEHKNGSEKDAVVASTPGQRAQKAALAAVGFLSGARS